ncbi:MAG: DUF393 domain-containing protein [Bdellovibrionales bacterium]|nr:DUF393 domain-containing protein [Bdellovibrionales bacterium]
MNQELYKKNPVLFFDGVCVLCNGFVDILLKLDVHHRLMFSSLQSESAKKFTPNSMSESMSTVVLWTEDKIYTESDAILQAFTIMGGGWSIMAIFKWIPKAVRDGIYRTIAKRRYRVFGKKNSCRLPSAEEKSWFLD